MTRADGGFDRNVFINCPFDAQYLPLLQAILFTVVSLGFNPRLAIERSDSSELRLDKISGLIRRSRYSIHDLSRIQASHPGEFYRLNMPFEFGIDYGSRLFGRGDLGRKRCLVLSRRPFEHLDAVSDLAGIDVKHHEDDRRELVRQLRNWFVETAGQREIPSASRLWSGFTDFLSQFHDQRMAEGFSADDLRTMPVREFVDFIGRWAAGQSS